MTTPKDPSPLILTKPVWFVRFVAFFLSGFSFPPGVHPRFMGSCNTQYPDETCTELDHFMTRAGRDWTKVLFWSYDLSTV